MSFPSRHSSIANPAERMPKDHAMTLVEVMVAMLIMGTFLLGFLSTALQSRRITESSVMQAAATALTYGLVEQIKMIGHNDIPYTGTTADPFQTNDAFPANKPGSPYVGINVRLNQNQVTSLQCVNNIDSTVTTAPATTPTSLTAPELDPTMKNIIGPISLSTVTGAQSQPLTLLVWAWVDNISSTTNDIEAAKCVTLVYAYEYNDGRGPKTAINREVIVLTPYAPMQTSN